MSPDRRSSQPHKAADLAIARRLRRLRGVYNITQAEMARRCGVSAVAWNHYEKGDNAPEWQTGERIADACGVTLDWIYRGRVDSLSLTMWRRLDEH